MSFFRLIPKSQWSLLVLAVATVLVIAGPVAYAINALNQGYHVTTTTQAVSGYGNCYNVRTTSGTDVFFPTNTQTEWNAFISKHPSNVTLSACGHTMIFLTSGTSWTVPADWNSASNTIEVIGGGGGGNYCHQSSGAPLYCINQQNATGGGGGGYSKVSNVTLTPGATVTYKVGLGGIASSTGGDTYFCNSNTNCASIAGTSVIVGAKGGGVGFGWVSPMPGGAGGSAALGVGTVKYSGGNGGNVTTNGAIPPIMGGGSGGGGAAGPFGAGAIGGLGNSNSIGTGGGGADGGTAGSPYVNGTPATGGPGGKNRFGTGSGAAEVAGTNGGGGGGSPVNPSSPKTAGAGGFGTEWDATHGAGGGGGGGKADNNTLFSNGGNGGLYGGGGGGSAEFTPGSGAQGIIVIIYN
jgi:hypothetical protein